MGAAPEANGRPCQPKMRSSTRAPLLHRIDMAAKQVEEMRASNAAGFPTDSSLAAAAQAEGSRLQMHQSGDTDAQFPPSTRVALSSPARPEASCGLVWLSLTLKTPQAGDSTCPLYSRSSWRVIALGGRQRTTRRWAEAEAKAAKAKGGPAKGKGGGKAQMKVKSVK
ncbi:hypothetical protein EMIHUDRAFT_251603 [Emiliania huxleyi CCMP1516]|uniref:Uncharacterized protein n=2 Tax=Emiliania huxleyi TaxID=2903 RepID=A0A0D3ITF0_EMIH1|nr:hypothetical protein EMIHUDRAFT_196922 [Emiliania huxleyi CCMP1516]XP_005791370.1 hypothetical protein EMIHUDRAFT_251603 [Emiliania huxleyi CCMP1516]EOD14535.1 hypothetical protein EMIHUDRAFT_196922 [Emiliania huxleyi CCMP1516]EOD38941.1 hypothetical protein EMIHUDRAFT_251603 [Emiliania huxleyi CCMP1516]|eukprot:XP_005766964.1 hypothetical protein EMIHUDRAFT_196922 [Emiliania huxleyi CCMP1516]